MNSKSYLKIYLVLLFACVSLPLSANDNSTQTVSLGNMTTLPLSQILRDSEDVPIAVIRSEPLRTEKGDLARGNQKIMITIDSSAEHPVMVHTTRFNPGDSKEITFNVDPFLGALQIPIYPAIDNTTGRAPFIAVIDNIEGVWCSNGFSVIEGHCERFTSSAAQWECPNNYQLGQVNRDCTLTTIKAINPVCDTTQGWYQHSSQCRKTDTRAANFYCSRGSFDGSSCVEYDSYPASSDCGGWSESAYYPGVCFTETDTFESPTGISCPSGYTLTYGGRCTKYRSAQLSCGSGGFLSGTSCVSYSYSSPRVTCPSGYSYNYSNCIKYSYDSQRAKFCDEGFTDIGNDMCEKITITSATPDCEGLLTFNPISDQCELTEIQPYIPDS